jgi:hypothetical protein
MKNFFDEFVDLVNNNVILSGDFAIDRLMLLTDRIGVKRHKTLNRLIDSSTKFGCCIEFVCAKDLSPDNVEEYADFYNNTEDKVRGYFREDDCWISINLDRINCWKDLEEVYAHEVVHLLQSVVFDGERDRGKFCMTLAYPEIFKSADKEKYLEWAESVADEDVPVYEVEAYYIQDRPRQVAFASEWLLEHRQEVWSNSWCCPV